MGLCIDALPCPAGHDEAGASVPRGAATQLPPTDANHLFANNVRFLSMAAIIAMHSLSVYPALHLEESPVAMMCLAQIFKFGTIAFFLIAGFLFGERIDEYSSLQYFRRRLSHVLLPWVVWYLCYCGLRVATDVVHQRVLLPSPGGYNFLYRECVSAGLFGTAYWFVPNLLIALAVLLVLRRILRDIRVGAALMLMSLFYAANIYGHWTSVVHSRAVFGFVFYLWLGAWGAWHFSTVQKWLDHIPGIAMPGFAALTYALAIGETKLLIHLHSADPMNTLRITNQVFSIVTVLAIVQVKHATWPRFVDVRTHTFGLYLAHPIGLAALKQILPHFETPLWTSHFGAATAFPIAFTITYGGCLIVVRMLLSCSWLRWTVGLAAHKHPARIGGNVVAEPPPGKGFAPGRRIGADGLAPVAGRH